MLPHICNIGSLCKTHCLFVGKLQPSATMLCHRAFFLLKTRVPVHVKELAKVLGKYEWWANTRKDTPQMRSWERGALIHRHALKKLVQAPAICVAEAIYIGHYINGKILNWFSEKKHIIFPCWNVESSHCCGKSLPKFQTSYEDIYEGWHLKSFT